MAALVVFLAPFAWISASAVSTSSTLPRLFRRLSEWTNSLSYQFWLLLLVALYIFAFEFLLYLFPLFVVETVISSTAMVFVTVEGFMLALTSQIRVERLRHNAVAF